MNRFSFFITSDRYTTCIYHLVAVDGHWTDHTNATLVKTMFYIIDFKIAESTIMLNSAACIKIKKGSKLQANQGRKFLSYLAAADQWRAVYAAS